MKPWSIKDVSAGKIYDVDNVSANMLHDFTNCTPLFLETLCGDKS